MKPKFESTLSSIIISLLSFIFLQLYILYPRKIQYTTLYNNNNNTITLYAYNNNYRPIEYGVLINNNKEFRIRIGSKERKVVFNGYKDTEISDTLNNSTSDTLNNSISDTLNNSISDTLNNSVVI
ncbi:hypothetical protein CWI39_0414p0010 [Hamiltosporidium magnivora]|uniref:Uncharacterized protein n=1 Tax=Hamiltosporidium magnivora TaxID=148818 RepID=A0A4Q9LFT4_9MICR|nr:hypothetical protein CWI39_0414p0010 [Hamiltosporidium magnivora]